MQPITNVSVFFKAIHKGKRKERAEHFRLDTLEGHQYLTPESLLDYERQFWKMIDSMQFKQAPKTATIKVNFGECDNHIYMVNLLSNQSQIIMR